MCPAENYGTYLCTGVQRALDAGVAAVHLEEPEFWARAGYSEGFKREWQSFYHEPWQAPDSSVDAQWRALQAQIFPLRRALQQVFDYIRTYDTRSGKTGALLRRHPQACSTTPYWHIVSPESSLARLNGCDGYIAQIWTGTDREPNVFRGVKKERTFETAFLEYGAMQNLVHATGRTIWYLDDPVEDNPRHDWTDYRATGNPRWSPRSFNPRSQNTKSPPGRSASSAASTPATSLRRTASRSRPATPANSRLSGAR